MPCPASIALNRNSNTSSVSCSTLSSPPVLGAIAGALGIITAKEVDGVLITEVAADGYEGLGRLKRVVAVVGTADGISLVGTVAVASTLTLVV